MKRQDLDKYLLESSSLLSQTPGAWCPAADVYRCQRGWLVKLDLAGVHEEDIVVQIAGRDLVVSGTRRDWWIDGREETHLMEIAYSFFERRIELPEGIVDAEVQTEYRDGMLLVHIMKKR